MKKALLCLSALFCLGLSACAVHTPHGSVVVDPDRTYGGGHGDSVLLDRLKKVAAKFNFV